MPVKYSDEIIEYAKELYLTVDEKGNRVYSFQKIVDLIRQRFDVKLTKQTVKNWADRYGWHRLLQQAIVVSAYDEESKRETEATITKVIEKLPADEELIEKLARAKRWVVVNHLKMAKKLYSEIQKRDASDKRFARLCEVANQVGKSVYEMLKEVDEQNENQPPVIIISEIDPPKVNSGGENAGN